MPDVTYNPGQSPAGNNWNLLTALPDSPAWGEGDAPDMIQAKLNNAIVNQGGTGVTSLTGTPNEVSVSAPSGPVVISLSPTLMLPIGAQVATPMAGDFSNKIATTAFVAGAAKGVVSVTGAIGQIVAAPTTGAVNLSLPSTLSGVLAIPALANIGTIATGVWNGTVIGPTYGGTGINNGAKTITLAGNLATSGAFALTLTTTGATNVTLPTTGTLVNTAVVTLSSLVITESQVTGLTAALALLAPLASPTFTGVPAAPTASPGTNTTQLATTAFVAAAVTGAGVSSLAGTTNQIVASASTGAVTLSLSTSLVLPSGTTATTQSPGDNSTKVATTAYVDASTAGVSSLAGTAGQIVASASTGAVTLSLPSTITGVTTISSLAITESQVTGLGASLALLAPLASPTFTGVPAGPTASGGTNTTQLATTAFVQAALSGGAVTSIAGTSGQITASASTGAVTLSLPSTITGVTTISSLAITESQVTGLTTALALLAPLASPALTGVPTAPTATAGTNTTQLATTAFVTSATAASTAVATGETSVIISNFQSNPDIDFTSGTYDEFVQNTSGTPAGWTAIPSGTPNTINTNAAYSQLYMVANGGGGSSTELQGIYMATPATPFTVTCKLTDANLSTSDQSSAGLFVGVAGASGAFMSICSYSTGGNYYQLFNRLYSNRTTASSNFDTQGALYGRPPLYLQMVVNSTTSVNLYYSYNGYCWFPISGSGIVNKNPGFTIGSVGLFVDAGDSTLPVQAYFDWIRFGTLAP